MAHVTLHLVEDDADTLHPETVWRVDGSGSGFVVYRGSLALVEAGPDAWPSCYPWQERIGRQPSVDAAVEALRALYPHADIARDDGNELVEPDFTFEVVDDIRPIDDLSGSTWEPAELARGNVEGDSHEVHGRALGIPERAGDD